MQQEICRTVAASFDLGGEVIEVHPLKRGHINETWVGTVATPLGRRRFIHQRINDSIFRDVPGLMENIRRVTAHLRDRIARGGVPGETCLEIVPTNAGAPYLAHSSLGSWRTYAYIEESEGFDVCTGPDLAREAAETLGRFTHYLLDLDPATLIEPLPGFQDTGLRLDQLAAAAGADRVGRVASAQAQLAFVAEHSHLGRVLTEERLRGALPIRVCHGDLKLNNVLFSRATGRGIAVVDLDTCMPGTILYDFGDLVRCTSVPVAEDEPDLTRVRVDLTLFEALAEGYLGTLRAALTPTERALLARAPQFLAFTLGVRFLADYLNGDTYFRIAHPAHNLQRAKTQFRIVECFLEREGEMTRIIEGSLER